MLRNLLSRAAAALLVIGALIAAGIINDRAGGILSERDILAIGRQWVETLTPARASQGSACMPTTGTVSGLVFAQDVNAAIAALLSSNSGASAPANDCSLAAVRGQVWLDTSTNLLKQFDGTSWVPIAFVDGTNHFWTPPIGGGIATATLASATTTDLGSVPQSYVTVTGTTTITGFGSSATTGTIHWVKFYGALTLTHNATSLILPAAVNLPTAAGDQVAMLALGGGNWQALAVTKADGTPVVSPAVPVATKLDYAGFTAPAKYQFGYGQAISRATFPDYLAAVTSTQSVTRSNGSPTLTGFSDISQFGAGMPIEGTGIPAATTISSCTGTSCTMSANASSGGTGNVVVFAWGYGSGGDTTTVGVMDCRGRTVIARDNMGGTPANRVTVAGGNFSATPLGATGGLQNQTLTIPQLPVVTPAGTVGGILLAGSGGTSFASTGVAAALQSLAPGNGGNISNTTLTGTFTGTPFGSGSAHPIVPPTVVNNCIVRVTL